MSHATRLDTGDIGPRLQEWLPRLVACDLDGTILGHDHTLSERVRTALDRLSARKVPFIVVTGRAIGAWLPTSRRLGLLGPAVCANGAMIVDEAGEILAQRPIPPAALAAVLARLHHATPDAVAAVERGGELLHEADFPRKSGALTRPTRIVTRCGLVTHPVTKLIVRSLGEPNAGWRATAVNVMASHLTVVDSGIADLVEAVAAGVSKATGLAWLATRLGIRRTDILAFGDMPNDVPMLRWAGQGVAVADGHPAALAAADAITASCAQDGVATYLEQVFP